MTTWLTAPDLLNRWDKNWIIHLDGVFQTADRLGDHHVHVARGMRRLAIVDTMPQVEEGYIGAPLSTSATFLNASVHAQIQHLFFLLVRTGLHLALKVHNNVKCDANLQHLCMLQSAACLKQV